MMETKQCTKCEGEFPATVEYFGRNKNASDGLTWWCRECLRALARENGTRRYADPEKRERIRTQKQESQARRMQDPEKRERVKAQGRESAARRRVDPEKREKILAQERESRVRAKADPVRHEKRVAQERESHVRAKADPVRHEKRVAQEQERLARVKADPERRKRLKAQRRESEARRRADPEKREKAKERKARILQDPIRREKHNALKRVVQIRRKARKRNLPDDFTQIDHENMLLYWGPKCAICGRVVMPNHPTLKLAVDHWIALNDPREENPGTVVTNLLPLCHGKGGCNNKKNNKDPVAWLMEEFGDVKAAVILQHIQAYFIWTERVRELPNTQTD